MKPTPLLDFWQKPSDAGEPIALLATTFALESDFFEQNCLARFLEVSSVDEQTGAAEDVVASVELHERLQSARVIVLADRVAPAQRTSLLWDLLTCRADTGGYLHAKVAVLLWERASRVILGSANLTAAGYRRNIELGLAADLGADCLLPPDVLAGIADELQSYLPLVPGYRQDVEVVVRAAETLEEFRRRIVDQPSGRSTVRVAFAPTNHRMRPLDQLDSVWSGARPLRAVHLSPYWDSDKPDVLSATGRLLTGRPAIDREQQVAVVMGLRREVGFPEALTAEVDSVHQLKRDDDEARELHAKCLLVESDQWVAALVGSSNHTVSGLGLSTRRHREMNVWLGASRSSDAGKALMGLIQLGRQVPADVERVAPADDEEDVEIPPLPLCFGLCRVTRDDDSKSWALHLAITSTSDMPETWSISIAGAAAVLTRTEWESRWAAADVVVALSADEAMPTYVLVRWNGIDSPWPIVADDRSALPPGPELSSLRARHLIAALASGRSLSDVLRMELERRDDGVATDWSVVVDPLKRLEVTDSLLRRGRELTVWLDGMQRRLERPVFTVDALNSRLNGPLGPESLAIKLVEDCEVGELPVAETIFTLAEIALAVGRVNWSRALERIDERTGRVQVERTLDGLAALAQRLGAEPPSLSTYAERAIKEARRCLIS